MQEEVHLKVLDFGKGAPKNVSPSFLLNYRKGSTGPFMVIYSSNEIQMCTVFLDGLNFPFSNEIFRFFFKNVI